MATTTNYGWTTPDDTDLVKNGADAIRDLGSAIDTSMNTALGTKKAGLVLLNTTSFTAVATQSINGVFSSDYSNYRILISPTTAGTNQQLTMRLRASGTDTSTNYVSNANFNSTATTVSASLNIRGTDEILVNGGITTGRPAFANIDIFNPFANLNTGFLINSGNEVSDGSFFYTVNTTGILKDTLSYDGFTLIISGGSNISGSLSVFGYNK
jgi:hypothetical protein